MAALVKALDNYTPTQIGENGHEEYGWSNLIQESIVQISFQLTRTDEIGLFRLEYALTKLLTKLTIKIDYGSISEKEVAKDYLSILYKMIGHTRDIVDGKGEYTLTYMMIYAWYNFFPQLSKFALKCLVDLGDINIHQYGSWKDIKYFCQYCKNKSMNDNHDLIIYAIEITNQQLRKDHSNLISNSNDVSLAAKWVPREKSSFGWLFQ